MAGKIQKKEECQSYSITNNSTNKLLNLYVTISALYMGVSLRPYIGNLQPYCKAFKWEYACILEQI